MRKQRWQDWLSLAVCMLGVWILISPLVLQHTMINGNFGTITVAMLIMYLAGYFGTSTAVMWNMYLVGFAISAIAASEIVSFKKWEVWADIFLGGWLLISPWILDFGNAVALTRSTVLAGVVVVLLSCLTIATVQESEQSLV